MKSKLIHYFNLIKFSHTIFSLPFAFIGAFLGYIDMPTNEKNWLLFIYVALCMFFARSAAMAFNRYIDAHFDSLNPRTQSREIPRQIFSKKLVLTLAIVNAIFFVATTYFINSVVFLLSPVALIVILGYSYSKRFTYLSHVWLGISLSLAPIGAYLVFNPVFSWQPILFGIITIFWVTGFDIIYAIQDISFDRKIGLKSIPSHFGLYKSLFFSRLLHISSILIIALVGIVYQYSFFYWIGTLIFSLFIFLEHKIVLENKRKEAINMAFAKYNGLAGVFFGLFVILDLCMQKF